MTKNSQNTSGKEITGRVRGAEDVMYHLLQHFIAATFGGAVTRVHGSTLKIATPYVMAVTPSGKEINKVIIEIGKLSNWAEQGTMNWKNARGTIKRKAKQSKNA